MIAYDVFEPATPSDAALERIDRVAFVREGFAWLALFVPVLWLVFHRMWLVLLGFMALLAVASTIPMLLDMSDVAAGWITLVLSLVFAFHANDLRRWTLERRGFALIGTVTGRDRAECERRFFDHWDAAANVAPGSESLPLRDDPREFTAQSGV